MGCDGVNGVPCSCNKTHTELNTYTRSENDKNCDYCGHSIDVHRSIIFFLITFFSFT